MRPGPLRRSAWLACAALALSAGAASAQINPFPDRDFILSESDLAVIEEVAGGLISGKVVPAGTKLQWFNGETHRRGTIEVLGSSQPRRATMPPAALYLPGQVAPRLAILRPELVQDAGRGVENRVQVNSGEPATGTGGRSVARRSADFSAPAPPS